MENEFPEWLRYSEDNSWVKVEENIAIIGIIEWAAKKVREFVFIKLPEKGKRIKKSDIYISLEAIKWSGHLSSPVSGEIIEVNEKLFDEPSKINEDPYGSWIMKVKLSDKRELNKLMDAKKAKEFYKK